jgi:hypoxanthine phosphoribosyltransferase
MTKKTISACGYLRDIVTSEGMKASVNCLVKGLRPLKKKFDAIAFRGMSGAIIAPNIAQRLGKDIIGIRKNDERRHSGYKVEGVICNNYIIVDDFIDSCKTIETIQSEIHDWCENATLVGIALYASYELNRECKRFMKTHNVWVFQNGCEAPIYPTKRNRR